MSRTDQYLPFAFEAINMVKIISGNKTIQLAEHNNISSVYKGYISSLGANIIQAGVKTAVYFYEAKESGSSGNKKLVTASIEYILQKAEGIKRPAADSNLSSRFTKNDLNVEQLAKQIMDAATALKLAIRTYNMI
jgi:CRISPR-associated protein Cmr5